jgi:hypothetical protein
MWVMLMAGLLGMAIPAASASAQPATPGAEDANWLFTVNFRSADLLSPERNSGQATLTLNGVDTDVLAFTDRPQRLAALVPVEDLIRLLEAVADDPPNATLVAQLPLSVGAFQAVLVLRSASYDRETGTLALEVAITASRVEGTPTPASGVDQELRAGYLFVDDLGVPAHVPVNVCGNTVDTVGLLNPAFGEVCVNE